MYDLSSYATGLFARFTPYSIGRGERTPYEFVVIGPWNHPAMWPAIRGDARYLGSHMDLDNPPADAVFATTQAAASELAAKVPGSWIRNLVTGDVTPPAAVAA